LDLSSGKSFDDRHRVCQVFCVNDLDFVLGFGFGFGFVVVLGFGFVVALGFGFVVALGFGFVVALGFAVVVGFGDGVQGKGDFSPSLA